MAFKPLKRKGGMCNEASWAFNDGYRYCYGYGVNRRPALGRAVL